MTTTLNRPSGDSHGSQGETVEPLRLRSQRLRTLRERQLALLIVCAGAMVAILDSSAVYVALPDIQKGLGFSEASLSWVVNAYLVPFGGLLLLAGKLGDTFGTKRVFMSGIALFVTASMVCGLAQNEAMLITARFVQGAGGAMSTAVVIAMIVTMFPKLREQTRALGLYAFVASSAAAIGLLAGGVLTQWLTWRAIFFVNLPIGALTIVSGLFLLDNVRDKVRENIDWFGAVTMVAALMLTVYTIAQSSGHSWGSPRTLVLGGGALLLLAVFVGWQALTKHPLLPLGLLRKGNTGRSNLVLALMVAGPAAMFFLVSLYLRGVLGFTVLQAGLAFLPATVAVGVASLKLAPRMLRRLEAKTVLSPAIVLLALGLLLLARIPADGNYFIDVLPAVILLGTGSGLATPPLLQLAVADATERDSGVRSGLINTTTQLGSAIGLAVLAPIAGNATAAALRAGHSQADALTSGYRIAFLVGLGVTAVALLLSVVVLRSETAVSAPPRRRGAKPRQRTASHRDPTGAKDADFLALGLGGTNMMAMLWSIAMGRRAVGVDLRGDPYVTLMHWPISRDLYHHLALIDKLMLERYGEERLPHLADGRLFKLHECWYVAGAEGGSGARTDEILYGWANDACIAGLAKSTEMIDDRWVDGHQQRRTATLTLPEVSPELDMTLVGRDLAEVFSEQPTFLSPAEELLIMLRRYLEEMEKMDLAAGVAPRCRLFLYHQVAQLASRAPLGRWLRRGSMKPRMRPGFRRVRGGRVRVQIEAIREIDSKGKFHRVRDPGRSRVRRLDLGVPELIMVAEGYAGSDAARLGFRQRPVMIDRQDGRGPVVAQSDYLFGLLGVYVDNNYRRRISSMFDEDGNEYWVRQSVIGHEDYAESAWTLAEVPDFMRFDPVREGLLKRGTNRRSAEYSGGFSHLTREFHLEQGELLTGVPKQVLGSTQSLITPRLITIVNKVGVDAQVAPNVVVAGASFGTGSFLSTSSGTAYIVGHSVRVLSYWQERKAGSSREAAIRALADRIKADTEAYVRQGADDFAQPVQPAVSRRRAKARMKAIESARRHRRAIARFNPRDDWSRPVVHPGRLYMEGMAPLGEQPAQEARELAADAPTAVSPPQQEGRLMLRTQYRSRWKDRRHIVSTAGKR